MDFYLTYKSKNIPGISDMVRNIIHIRGPIMTSYILFRHNLIYKSQLPSICGQSQQLTFGVYYKYSSKPSFKGSVDIYNFNESYKVLTRYWSEPPETQNTTVKYPSWCQSGDRQIPDQGHLQVGPAGNWPMFISLVVEHNGNRCYRTLSFVPWPTEWELAC